MTANFVLIALALVTGWIALFPMRRSLGAWAYHVSAWLVGLLAWPLVTALTNLFGRGYDWTAVIAGHAVLIAVFVVAGVVLSKRERTEPVGTVAWWTWVVAGAAVLGGAAALTWAGITMVSFDSYTHYDISGIWLLDTGRIDTTVIGGRNVFVPSLHAAVRFLGGEWTYVVYPMLSVSALALLLTVLWRQALRRLGTWVRSALSVLLVVMLATLPAWAFHSLFVHSNMISATYLTLAVVGLGMCSGFGDRSVAPVSSAWTVLAGVGMAGLTLSRPDGLAYVFVPLALAALLYLGGSLRSGSYAVAFGSMLVPVLAVYGSTIATLGVWNAYKLDGIVVVGLLGVAVAFWLATVLVRTRTPLKAWLEVSGNATRLAVTVNVVAVPLLVYWKREEFVVALSNMLGNLLQHGEWGFVWYAIFGVIALSLVFQRVTRRSEWSWYLLYVIAQFLVVAAVVHGVAHPGRLSWMDSFNRISLHVLPIAFWYIGSFCGSVIDSYWHEDEVSSV